MKRVAGENEKHSFCTIIAVQLQDKSIRFALQKHSF